MFHLITKIKDKKPCRCCRHRNSTTFCFQQGNRIMYLFDEIWVCFFFCFFKRRFTILLISHTRRRICLNIRRLFWGVDDKVPSFFLFYLFFKEWIALCIPMSLKTKRKSGVETKGADKTPCSESRNEKQTLSSWINTHTSSRAGRQLLVLTLLSTVTSLDSWFFFVGVRVCLCVWRGESKRYKELSCLLV